MGKVVDEVGAGCVEGVVYLFGGGLGLAELEVVANGAAQQCVALGHVDEIASHRRGGGLAVSARGVVELYAA